MVNATQEYMMQGRKLNQYETSPTLESVIWITGLSGAGKTTLAQAMALRLRKSSLPVVLLDGDELREVFGASSMTVQNYGREARLALAMQYAHLCRILTGQGLTVVIATISLFREVHEWNRNNLPSYLEVYLKVPLEELRRRDPKGIYRRFDAGELTQVAGLDLVIDEPEKPDWLIEFTPQLCLDKVADKLIKKILNTNS